mgnify:CR=1 FL=1
MTITDGRLLAEVDTLHGTLSGPATRKLCERAYTRFGDARYARLATISNGHLYNLRGSQAYQRQRGPVDKTRPVKLAIGERRKPRPEGRPGFLRVDSVHQGDLDGIKGLYHLNLVDEITQFQFIGSVERICERFLLPVLENLLAAFPFVVLGFHADNGSEYINKRVAALLEKLRIQEFTKSRARRTNDNALVESKNGSVVRKHLGYAHIPGRFAPKVNAFTQGVLSPYLNFHRPCFFPTEELDARGRVFSSRVAPDGGFALWAVVAIFFANRRDEKWQKPAAVALWKDAVLIGFALVVTAAVFPATTRAPSAGISKLWSSWSPAVKRTWILSPSRTPSAPAAVSWPVTYHHSVRKSGWGPWSAGKTKGLGSSARAYPAVSPPPMASARFRTAWTWRKSTLCPRPSVPLSPRNTGALLQS